MLYRSFFTRFSAFIFVFLLLQSCTQEVQYEAEHQLEVRLNGRNNYEPFPLSDIVDSSSVIHIQCDPPAGNVTDVKFQHGCYYLLDNLNNAVVKVDSLGRPHSQSILTEATFSISLTMRTARPLEEYGPLTPAVSSGSSCIPSPAASGSV